MTKTQQADNRAIYEYMTVLAVFVVPTLLLLASMTNSALGQVATVPTRTPAATPVSQHFLPLIIEGTTQEYPPPFFDKLSYDPSYNHTDDLDCNSYRVNGHIYNMAEEYWVGETLTVHVSASGLDKLIPVATAQTYSTPAWQVDLPTSMPSCTVQLLKWNNVPASPTYKLFPNQDCFWNLIWLSFKQTR